MNEFENNELGGTSEPPINRGAAVSVDPDAEPTLPPTVTPLPDLAEAATDHAMNSIPNEGPQRVAHYLENLIEETNAELDKISKMVSIIQTVAFIAVAILAIYVAVKMRKGNPNAGSVAS